MGNGAKSGNYAKKVSIWCDDCAEMVTFFQHNYIDGDIDYEIAVKDSCCCSGYQGFVGRARRAWHAFWAKPISYTGVYIEDGNRAKTFLQDCLKFIDEGDGRQRERLNS